MNQPIIALDARSIGQQHTGDSTYWTGLVRGLAKLDSDLRYLLLSNAPAPPGIPVDGRFTWVELKSQSERWWSLVRFPLAARRLGARVFHTQYNLSPIVAHGGVTTIHDVSFYHEPSWFKPRDRVLLQRFVPASARRAEKVFTVSEFSKREILANISGLEGKVSITPNACDDAIHRVDLDGARRIVANQVGVSGPFLLTVGTRWPRKNFKLAARAASALSDALPHRLVVTGKAGWGEEEQCERAVYPGYVDTETLCALYSAADLYLAPALYEGFGITLLEAFRCGCPVVASANGAHEEVAGDAAVIMKSWDSTHWARQIEDLLSDSSKLESMRQAGSARDLHFTWEATARAAEAAYREILR